jgi:hypothetical protein
MGEKSVVRVINPVPDGKVFLSPAMAMSPIVECFGFLIRKPLNFF